MIAHRAARSCPALCLPGMAIDQYMSTRGTRFWPIPICIDPTLCVYLCINDIHIYIYYIYIYYIIYYIYMCVYVCVSSAVQPSQRSCQEKVTSALQGVLRPNFVSVKIWRILGSVVPTNSIQESQSPDVSYLPTAQKYHKTYKQLGYFSHLQVAVVIFKWRPPQFEWVWNLMLPAFLRHEVSYSWLTSPHG
jgi:hypothetical protein